MSVYQAALDETRTQLEVERNQHAAYMRQTRERLEAYQAEHQAELSALRVRLRAVEQERDELKTVLRAIRKALSPEADGEYHTVRKWLDKRGIYHDDLSGIRVVYEAARAALQAAPKGRTEPEP